MITFEVVPFKSSYHVIFGRPTYHKFHARACYIYNKLKIPGPNDLLAVLVRKPYLCTSAEENDKFVWDEAADEALQGLKNILSSPPILAAPAESSLCSSIWQPPTKSSVSSWCDRKKDMSMESKGPRKLRHYFQEHPDRAKLPATIINNSDATGVAKWGIELSAFDINYGRTAIKSQVLADFIADWTEAPGTPVPEPEAWVMHFDGSKQHQGSGLELP
ncbi:hypothetical protein QYE76_024705 [Lolium multiflorum]|uniref:Reverse transcriptase/retrotransposon-derived protein RNase H-like domain-containing protein n=1 Tax=Lolium multiflorum TaxID=4521 RepID=A0AAD8VWB4_LOLMU|nr:hypothetical protein QYE76_024705 [Lolium multiflorum]